MVAGSERRFHLLPWFAGLSLFCIVVTSGLSAWLLSQFLSENMLRRDAEVSREFIESIILSENIGAFFRSTDGSEGRERLESFFNHISHMPGVIGANVYNAGRVVLWSSTPELIGRRFEHNNELEHAFGGDLEIELRRGGVRDKPEHVALSVQSGVRFIEAYIPIWDRAAGEVVGVVELYKLPIALAATIARGNQLVWTSAALSAALLYSALFWIVRRASRLIRDQQARLVEAETLARLGEMASAVAHSLRNPLASIRSGAELARDEEPARLPDLARDIVAQVDRMTRWIRDLLHFANVDRARPEPFDVGAVLRDRVADLAPQLARQNVTQSLAIAENLPPVLGHAMLVGQALNSLIANAIEAMPSGGALRVEAVHAPERRTVEIRISDSGRGLSAEQLALVFRPYFTTKADGLGLGLALARRIVAGFGGSLDLASAPGEGTTATLRLLSAS